MMKVPGMYSCREVHEHASMGTAEDLGFVARLKYNLHLMMCVHCARYVRQMYDLGEYARRILGAPPDPERCRRLENEVMTHCDGRDH